MKKMHKSDILEYTDRMAAQNVACSRIEPELFEHYNVKRGLRDKNGTGVLAGLTTISAIKSYNETENGKEPCAGELRYRGINVKDLVGGCIAENRFGFEEVSFLLLFGHLPNEQELAEYCDIMAALRCLPTNFVRDVVMKAPSKDIMNSLTRSVLTLSAYDSDPSDMRPENVLRQCLSLISRFPMLSVYGYQAYNHYVCNDSLYIHRPDPKLSTAENILRLLRPDKAYTALEAQVLDIALILHMEHGGGNNSSFTTHVVASSGSDTFSVMAAALCSLKGPKHGGANIKVHKMVEDMKANVSDPTNEGQVADYLAKVIQKQAGDGSGLIYGMGHAVYTLSDPRAVILKENARAYSQKCGFSDDFRTLELIEQLTPELFLKYKGEKKKMCANVDLYSGLIYDMLRIPQELFTPLFMSARIAGWSAHRIEELTSGSRIMRPAYKNVSLPRRFVPIGERVDNHSAPAEYIPPEER